MKIIRNTSLYMAAGLVPNLVNLLVLPIYSRFLLPEDFGIVSLVMTFVTFAGTVLGLQLSNSISRLYFDYEGAQRSRYSSTIFNSTILINLLLLIPMLLLGPRLVAFLFPAVVIPYQRVFLPGLVIMFFQNFINFGNAMLRVQERGWAVFSGGILYLSVSIILGLYGVVFRSWGASGLLLAMAGAKMAHGLFYLFILRAHLKLSLDIPMLWGALVYSLPIIPHSLGGMLFMMSDKYVASFFVGVDDIGLYEFADKFALVYHFMVLSFYHAMSPVFMRASLQNKQHAGLRFGRIITCWMSGFAVVCLGMGLFLGNLIEILFPSRFHAAAVYIPILLTAYLFRGLYGFAADALLFMKKTYLIPVISLTAGGLNVVGNLVLLPYFGIMAAAWTTLLSLLSSFVLAVLLSRRVYPIRFDWYRLFLIFIAMVGTLLLGLTFDVGSVVGNLSIKSLFFLCFLGWVMYADFGGIRQMVFMLLKSRSEAVAGKRI